jgi:hypothetical protein
MAGSPPRFIAAIFAAGLLVISTAGPLASHGHQPAPLEALTFLLGTWGPSGADPSGAAAGTATFARSLQGRVIVRTSFAEYPASAARPASRHEDLMVIFQAGADAIRADYYDNEGHVIRYTVTVPGAGEASFVSDTVAGAPRYRLSYRLAPDGILRGMFAIAPPDRPEAFAPYLSWESKRQ